MEAATPLRQPQVRTQGDYLVIDGVVIRDRCAVRIVTARESAGEDPVKAIEDAIEIGARVLDREQTSADVDFVKSEFERISSEVETAFTDRARTVAEYFGSKVDETFKPRSGHLAQALERHFSDESSAAVQHRVRALVEEVMAKSRQDLIQQFSAADGRNPLADFKQATLAVTKHASDRQETHLRLLQEKLANMEKELQALRSERKQELELKAERERGTAKGRDFEEFVYGIIDQIAANQGDDCDHVGDHKGVTRKTGDIIVAIDGAHGPARGRIVLEAKNSKLSKASALEELDHCLTERAADFAVMVVCGEEKLPSRTHPLREYNGNKLIVTLDPEGESHLPLEVAYSLARARVLAKSSDSEALDTAGLHDAIERALAGMEDVRRIKAQLTGATTNIEQARSILETMASGVREQLVRVDKLLAAAAQSG
jgi:hypothetical protein